MSNEGSGEQPTSVEEIVNDFWPFDRGDHRGDYDQYEEWLFKQAIEKIKAYGAEERRQAKIPVYSWLGVWRDKLPPEAVTQLQDILGEGENTNNG